MNNRNPSAALLAAMSDSHLWALAPAWLSSAATYAAILESGTMPPSAARKAAPSVVSPPRVAVIPIIGPLSQRPNFASQLFAWSDYTTVEQQLQAKLGDTTVEQIWLFIDSPGGTVSGLPELSDAIYAARAVKPVIAFGSGLVASAAFWLASQSSAFFSQPSAEIGSVGVVCVHMDISQQLANEGIRPTIIASSPYKAEGSPLQPLTPDALTYEKSRIDAIHEDFVAPLSRGRRLKPATVQADFGNGRVIGARNALNVGMVDGISPSLADALRSPPTVRRRMTAWDMNVATASAELGVDLAARPSFPQRSRMQRELEILELS